MLNRILFLIFEHVEHLIKLLKTVVVKLYIAMMYVLNRVFLCVQGCISRSI